MRYWTLSLLLLISVSTLAGKKNGQKKTKIDLFSPQLQTEVNFEGSKVVGEYQQASEARAIVEDEKSLINLVEPRRSLKFRVQQTQEWNQ